MEGEEGDNSSSNSKHNNHGRRHTSSDTDGAASNSSHHQSAKNHVEPSSVSQSGGVKPDKDSRRDLSLSFSTSSSGASPGRKRPLWATTSASHSHEQMENQGADTEERLDKPHNLSRSSLDGKPSESSAASSSSSSSQRVPPSPASTSSSTTKRIRIRSSSFSSEVSANRMAKTPGDRAEQQQQQQQQQQHQQTMKQPLVQGNRGSGLGRTNHSPCNSPRKQHPTAQARRTAKQKSRERSQSTPTTESGVIKTNGGTRSSKDCSEDSNDAASFDASGLPPPPLQATSSGSTRIRISSSSRATTKGRHSNEASSQPNGTKNQISGDGVSKIKSHREDDEEDHDKETRKRKSPEKSAQVGEVLAKDQTTGRPSPSGKDTGQGIAATKTESTSAALKTDTSTADQSTNEDSTTSSRVARWRAHQMAEDYVELAGRMMYPSTPTLGDCFGYDYLRSRSSGASGGGGSNGSGTSGPQYPMERMTALGLLLSPLRRPSVIERWSPYEIATFEAAMTLYGKNFHILQKYVTTKTTKELIEFYYVWKKTSHYKTWKQQFEPDIESDDD